MDKDTGQSEGKECKKSEAETQRDSTVEFFRNCQKEYFLCGICLGWANQKMVYLAEIFKQTWSLIHI